MDYRIVNKRMRSFCIRMYPRGGMGWGGVTSVYSLIPRTFVESAQNLTPEQSQGGCKAYHILVTALFGDHAISCLTWAVESQASTLALRDTSPHPHALNTSPPPPHHINHQSPPALPYDSCKKQTQNQTKRQKHMTLTQ